MEHIKAIYLRRHVFRFEEYFNEIHRTQTPKSKWIEKKHSDGSGLVVSALVTNPRRDPNAPRYEWRDKEYETRDITDLNGFLCCICCGVPFIAMKAVLMMLIHLLLVTPSTLILAVCLFPYQLVMFYIASMSTALLSLRAKCMVFVGGWMLYTLFLILYVIAINVTCTVFSVYAAVKTSLVSDYNVFGGFLDALRIVTENLKILWSNNTAEFHAYCRSIGRYRLDEAAGDEQWDISLISWCSRLTAFVQIVLSILLIMPSVLVLIAVYFLPFTVHILCRLYLVQFVGHYIGRCIPKQPCLALIGLPFVVLLLVSIPLLAALYLVLFVWLYSAFFMKAVVIEKYTDSPFDALQHLSYILNTVKLYHHTLAAFSFQSGLATMCTEAQSGGPDEYDGFDFDPESAANVAQREAIKLRKRTMAATMFPSGSGFSCSFTAVPDHYNATSRDPDDDRLESMGFRGRCSRPRRLAVVQEGNSNEVTLQDITAIFADKSKNEELITMGKTTKIGVDEEECTESESAQIAAGKGEDIEVEVQVTVSENEVVSKKRMTLLSILEMQDHMTMLNGGWEPSVSVEMEQLHLAQEDKLNAKWGRSKNARSRIPTESPSATPVNSQRTRPTISSTAECLDDGEGLLRPM